MNITLSENLWLPIKYGGLGLGIRRVPRMALTRFLASAADTLSLQNATLGSEDSTPRDPEGDPLEALMANTTGPDKDAQGQTLSGTRRFWNASLKT